LFLIASDNDTASIPNATAEQCSDNNNPSFGISSNALLSHTSVSTTNIPTATSIVSNIGSDVPSNIFTTDPIDASQDNPADLSLTTTTATTTQALQPSNSSEYMAYQ